MVKTFDPESWKSYCELVKEHQRAINAELEASRAMFDRTGTAKAWLMAVMHEQEVRTRYEAMRKEFEWTGTPRAADESE
jgi:hypothetical protein